MPITGGMLPNGTVTGMTATSAVHYGSKVTGKVIGITVKDDLDASQAFARLLHSY